jgi:hypothetical protein
MAAKFRSVEHLREFACRVHGGDCLTASPVGMHTRVSWRCSKSEHAPFLATLSNVVHSKTWCPACDAERRRLHPPKPHIDREKVEMRVSERGGQIVQILGNGKWKGSKTRLRLRCANWHEWSADASNLMYAGSWCPECRLKGERIVRAIFKETYGATFNKARPPWLQSVTGRKLELDGYNETLQVAFEYQGPHHFTRDSVKLTDSLKRKACLDQGVRLVTIDAIKRPFPGTNVLQKVVEAFARDGILEVPILPKEDVFARELEDLQQFARQRGGTLVSDTYLGGEPHEWHCGEPSHPTWRATAWLVTKHGSWCPSCAGNCPLGIYGLREWGASVGLALLTDQYAGTISKIRVAVQSGWTSHQQHKGQYRTIIA